MIAHRPAAPAPVISGL